MGLLGHKITVLMIGMLRLLRHGKAEAMNWSHAGENVGWGKRGQGIDFVEDEVMWWAVEKVVEMCLW